MEDAGSPRYDRDASVVPVMWVGGDVGEGMFGEGYEGDADCPAFPFMAARWDDDMTARSAALVGSRVCSAIVLSWVAWVGEAFFGVVPMTIFLVEYWRFMAPADWLAGGVGAGGGMVGS